MRHLQLATFCALSACVGTIGDDGGPAGAGAPGPGDPQIAAACSSTYAPGHVPIHRLTNAEYDNTVRDLLYTKSQPAQAFEPTPPGRSGWRNDSDALKISDDLVNAYYDAAEALAKEVIQSKATPGGAYARLVSCAPSAACARSTLAALGARAYRRPLTDAEVGALAGVAAKAPDFDTGLADAMTSILVSPKFIFVHVTAPQSNVQGATFALDDYALAARLSYALWQTMPDDELTTLAQKGALHAPDVLAAQVRRMLKDARVGGFLRSLRDDWAGLESLADPAGTLAGLDDALRASMVGEVDAFLRDLVTANRSMLEVVTARSTFANSALAQYYGLPAAGASFTRVDLPANRRGIVTSAAVLTATAGATTYTHPVKRGKWVTHQITCTPAPPPPANVPVVDFGSADGTTPRQKLENHVKEPCAGCHKVMDALGLGLENFDPFGRWRDRYADIPGPIDASGTLESGARFTTPAEMYDDLAADPETRACLAQQIMAYALTRAMTSNDDQCVAKAIGAAAVGPDGTFADLVVKIVGSRQFFMQTGEAP
jgi:hypothetical protein